MSDVFRGAVKIKWRRPKMLSSGVSRYLDDEFEEILYTRTYNKSGVARGQATILRKRQRQSDVIDVWVEKAIVWENIDKDSDF